MLDKFDIRRAMLQRRKTMTPEDAASRSAAVRRRLLELPELSSADTVLTYVSSKDNEVDTRTAIGMLLGRGKTVLVPLSQPDRTVLWSRLDALNELVPGRFGILEPLREYRRIQSPPNNAPVLVPGIAFTARGHRIGYGGGYFDRFLARHNGCKIGLAYDCQIIESIPTEKHDIPVDIVIAESATYRR